MSHTVTVMATEKFTLVLYDKSGQQTVPFLIISLFKSVLVLVAGKKRTKPLKAINDTEEAFPPTSFQGHQQFPQALVCHLCYCPLSPELF